MNNMSAVDLARLVRTKAVSPLEILKSHLGAIARANPAINGYLHARRGAGDGGGSSG